MSVTELVPLTDDRGRVIPLTDTTEPEPGSVVFMNGEFGCAWQRQFDDGLWRSVRGGRPRDWAWLKTKRNLVLIYDAPVRGEGS